MAANLTGAPLGIIAGRGKLPIELARVATGNGRQVLILAIIGQANKSIVSGYPHKWLRAGEAGRAITLLRTANITEIVFAGGVTRASIWSLRPDRRTARFAAKVGMRALGDDSLLSAIIKEFEGEGFKVVGADTIWEDARMTNGPLGKVEPDEQAWHDIHRGVRVASALGTADVGQSVVVQQGIVLAVEAIEGTDAMIARAGSLVREGEAGVLVKLCKPGQNLRVDLPTIGLETVHMAHKAGLKGIAIEAGNALLLDRAKVIETADAFGLFIVGVTPKTIASALPDDGQ